jgi:hypothetical protein
MQIYDETLLYCGMYRIKSPLCVTNQQIHNHPLQTLPPSITGQLITYSPILDSFGNFLRRLAFASTSTFLYAYITDCSICQFTVQLRTTEKQEG